MTNLPATGKSLAPPETNGGEGEGGYHAATGSARGIRAGGMETGKQRDTNMAGSEVEDLASLESRRVNEGAVVELIRRRYKENKIYVSKAFAARARFFYLTAVSCFLTSGIIS